MAHSANAAHTASTPTYIQQHHHYDAFGRLVAQMDQRVWHSARTHLGQGPTHTQTHTQAQHAQQWHVDAAGNRMPQPGLMHPANRPDFDGERHLRYDAWGNVVELRYARGPHTGTVVRLAYDGLHQLRLSQTESPDGHLLRVAYSYDAFGRRLGFVAQTRTCDMIGCAHE